MTVPAHATASLTASDQDPSAWYPFSGPSAAAVAPQLRILVLGTGLTKDAAPVGMTVNALDGLSDLDGWTSAAISAFGALYPPTSLTVDTYRVTGETLVPATSCALQAPQTLYQAFTSLTPTAMASKYDAVLLDIDPSCFLDSADWIHSKVGWTGQGKEDGMQDYLMRHPLDPSYTRDSAGGPALTFDGLYTEHSGDALGWSGSGGAGDPLHPYHEAPESFWWRHYWDQYLYFDQIAAYLDQLRTQGLPVVVPAGDSGFSWWWPSRHRWQQILGLAGLDSVITVGAAANTGNPQAADHGWVLGPNDSFGVGHGGNVKPDLVAPGDLTVEVGTASWLYQQSSCVSQSPAWVCGRPMTSVAGYLAQGAAANTISPVLGQASSRVAASVVALQVAQIRHRWPGGWPAGRDMTGEMRSLLQAKSSLLTGPWGGSNTPPAPFEQGAGLLQGSPQPADVSRSPLAVGPLNLGVSNARCPQLEACAPPLVVPFDPSGGKPSSVSCQTQYLLGAGMSGMPRRLRFADTHDPEPVACSLAQNPDGSWKLTAQVVTPVSYAGADCGWATIVAQAPVTLPYCRLAGLTLRFRMYFPQSRDIDGDFVSLAAYDPGYSYLGNPLGILPVGTPGQQVAGTVANMVTTNLPPSVTLYTGQTKLDQTLNRHGIATIDNVLPGVYSYQPTGSYPLHPPAGLWSDPQHRRTSSNQCPAFPCWAPTEAGSPANFQHTYPFVVPSALPCSVFSALPPPVGSPPPPADDPLFPACRPDEGSWHVSGTRTDGSYIHEDYTYDDVNGACLMSTDYIQSNLQDPQPQTFFPNLQDSAEIPYGAVSFPCGNGGVDVNTRFGVGTAGVWIRNLRGGSTVIPSQNPVLGTSQPDPLRSWLAYDPSRSDHDFDMVQCQYDTPNVPIGLNALPSNCNEIVPVWRVGACQTATSPPCTSADPPGAASPDWSHVRAFYDPASAGQDPLGSHQVIPALLLHKSFPLPTPHYDLEFVLNLGFSVRNALFLVVAAAGEGAHSAVVANTGYSCTIGCSMVVGTVDPAWSPQASMTTCGSCDQPQRRSLEFHSRAYASNSGDIWLILIPTSLTEPAQVDLSQMGFMLQSFDKTPVLRWSAHSDDSYQANPSDPNNYFVEVNPNLDYGLDVLTTKCTSLFGCDDYRFYMDAPRGLDTSVDDVFIGLNDTITPGTTQTDTCLPVHEWVPPPTYVGGSMQYWDPSTTLWRVQDPQLAAWTVNRLNTATSGAGPPTVLESYPELTVNGMFDANIAIPFADLLKGGSNLGPSHRPGPLRVRFGASGATAPGCSTQSPAGAYSQDSRVCNVPNSLVPYSPSPLDPSKQVPVAPYSTAAPLYCGTYTVEPWLALEGLYTAFGTVLGWAYNGVTWYPCWEEFTQTTGAYWNTLTVRPIQKTCAGT